MWSAGGAVECRGLSKQNRGGGAGPADTGEAFSDSIPQETFLPGCLIYVWDPTPFLPKSIKVATALCTTLE